MKDFTALQQQCLSELNKAGIKTGPVSAWIVNTRAKKRWGFCKKEKDGTYVIEIAQLLLKDDRIPEKAVKETIIHELLHTCYGCMNHQKRWKHYAQIMNDTYGYNIKRTTSGIEKGVENYEPKRMEVKYVFTCSGCGAKVYMKRESKFTRYYRNYICTKCGTQGWQKRKVAV